TMTGNTGNNQLDGTAGNDTLTGGTGADTLIGGLGDDVLNGSDGNDVFIGGAGNDIISGGRGSDTVYFNLGDGNDIIDNQTDDINTTTDVLVFGQGIALNDLTFMRYNNSADSTVLINGTTDSILVKNYFSQPQYYNNIQLHFADGTVVTYQQLLHMGYVNQGDDSNNALNGFWGNDTLIGGLGDDTLIGGLGTDSYQLGLGDDTVIYHYNQDGGDYVADDLTNEQINAGISDGIDTYKIFNVPNSPVIQFGIEANTERYPNLVLTIGDNNVNLGTQFADDWRDSVSVGWQGIYIENFFTRNPAGSNNGTPVLTAASAQDVFVFYSDDGVTEINRLTGQEVYDFYFAPQNHAPAQTEALAILANGIEDTTYTLFASDLLQGYTDADGDTLSVINLQATHGSLVDNQNGTYSFTPNANFNGTINLSYQVSDGHGGIAEASNSFVLDAVNDIPFISNMSGEVGEDGFITGGGGYYDVEGDVLSYRIIGDVPEGFVLDGNNGAFGFSYTPTVADQTLKVGESKQLSVQYVANDGQADSLPATIQITINGVNDAPTGSATAILSNTTANTTYTLLASALLQGFSDVDGDTLSINNLMADHATVVNNSNGTFTLMLEANYSGVVGLSYQVTDGHNSSVDATQSFNVVGGNNTTGTTGAD
ncbi:MAG TPA: cadherin-like domain-containing protein, partial [Agitococcus sp.]|nr:cadherin-like domain-containing protein [Agitococcus sp.]